MKTRILWTALAALLAGVVLAGGAAGKGTRTPTPSSTGKQAATGRGGLSVDQRPAAKAAPVTPSPQYDSAKKPAGAKVVSPRPLLPVTVLYDQYNNPSGDITSQNFEAANDAFDSEAADDFVVPAGRMWSITTVDVQGDYAGGTGGPAASFNVVFYRNSASLPATVVATRAAMGYTNTSGDFAITLSPAVTLGSGTYWMGVQANQNLTPAGQWFWKNRSVTANQGAAWRNPGDGFGTGCTSFTRKTTCFPGAPPDQVFKLTGNSLIVNHTGSLAGSDPTITDPGGRMFRDGVVSTCAAPKTFPGTFGAAGAFHYRTHTIRNASASPACVTVTLDPVTCVGSPSIFASAYSNSFNPANISQNYLADIGASPQSAPSAFSFTVPAGGKVVLVISEVNANAGCAGYEVVEDVPLSAPVYAESFDSVTAPALPAGWSAANATGAAPLWTTSSAGVPAPAADSAPNAAFVDDPGTISDKVVDSPSISIHTPSAQLSFFQNRNLESNFDGGVLELSIDGGAFQDILAAGGSFEARGYNATISSCCGNPLASRKAWSGSSGGFVYTAVNLPAAAAGHAVRLRWRMGSDNSIAVQGWRIDTIQLRDGHQLTALKAGNGAGTVTSSPAGVSCGATCSSTFEVGSTVTLTAAADATSTFTGWSGSGCSGTGACSVAIDAVKSVTATFVLQQRALTVAKTGSGSGTVTSSPAGIACGATCSAQFTHGTSVTLAANASTKSIFKGWSGACSGTGACTVSMVANLSVTANFVPKCIVPKVVGLRLKKAKAKIRKAHCRTGKIRRKASKAKKKGRVLSQKPKPGKKLANGAKVNLVVGKGHR